MPEFYIARSPLLLLFSSFGSQTLSLVPFYSAYALVSTNHIILALPTANALLAPFRVVQGHSQLISMSDFNAQMPDMDEAFGLDGFGGLGLGNGENLMPGGLQNAYESVQTPAAEDG